MKDSNRIYFFAFVASFIILHLSRKLARVIPILKIRMRSIGSAYSLFAIFIILVMFSWIIGGGGLSLFNLNIWRVYEFRRVAGAQIFSGLFAYLMPLTGKVILPSLFSFYLMKRKYMRCCFVFFLEVLFFGFTHHKSMLLFPLLILALYISLQRDNIARDSMILYISLLVLFISHFLLTRSILLISLFIRRALFVTSNMHFVYFDYFSNVGPIFMSNSLLSSFFKYPLAVPPTQAISFFQHGHYNTWMNVGFLGTGYMHFGYWGMTLFSVIVGIILGFTDRLAKRGLPLWFAVSLVFIPFLSLASSDLTTALNTHGLFLSMAILWVFSQDTKIATLGRQSINPNLDATMGSTPLDGHGKAVRTRTEL